MKKFIYSLVFVFLSVFSVQAQDYTPSHNKGIKIKTTVAASTDSLIAIQPNGKIVRSTKTIDDIATNLSELVDDIGATDPIIANTIFVDTVNGNDITGVLENRNRPIKTLAEAYNRLPANGVVWDINFVDGNVIRDMSEPMPSIAFNLVSSSTGTFDFSGLEGEEGRTAGNKQFLFPNAKMLFGGPAKYFGSLNQLTIVANEIEINCNTPNANPGFFRSEINNINSSITVNNLSINSTSTITGHTGDLTINGTLNIIMMQGIGGNGGWLTTVYINKIVIPDDGLTRVLFFGRTPSNFFKTQEVSGNSELIFTTIASTPIKIDLDGFNITNGATVSILDRTKALVTLTGNAGDNLINICANANNPGPSVDYKLLFDGFTGKVEDLYYNLYAFEFVNSSVTFENNLAKRSSVNQTGTSKGFIFRGVNSFTSVNNSEELIIDINPLTPLTLFDYGYTTTNVKTFGKNINVVKPNATFKEKLNEVIVRSKIDLVNRLLDTNTTYIVDGVIALASNDSIVVPPGGNLTLNGYGLEASKIIKDVAGQAIFYSRSGGSGGLLMDGLKISSGAGSIFELTDETGFNAVEFVKVNFEDSNSLGVLNGYRQSLWTNIGLFNNSDGITFSGTWLGGVRNESMIVRNMAGSTGTVFKAGASLIFNSRFYSDANIDLPTGWKLLDFSNSNFTTSETLQLQGMILTRSGTIDDTDILYTPNITEEDSKSRWSGNIGIKNSSVPFTKLKSPDGSIFKITVDDSGTLISTEL